MRKVSIKMPANIAYEVTNFGTLKAHNLFEVLTKENYIKKKEKNATNSIENLTCYGHTIDSAEYDMLTNKVNLYLGTIYETSE